MTIKYGENTNNYLLWFNELNEIISEGIYITDRRGIVITMNETFSRITGLEGHDLVGMNIQEHLDKQYETGEYRRLDIDQSETIQVNKEYVVEKPDSMWKMVLSKKADVSYAFLIMNRGKRIPVLLTGHPIYDDKGRIQYVMGMIQELNQDDSLKSELLKLEDENRKYLSEIEYYRINQKSKQAFVGTSEKIQEIRELIDNIASTDVNVIVYGETGVGKEIVAQRIHDMSARRDSAYIKVNCSAIPETLFESEFFGYEKGAFTGAMNRTKIGYFEMASKGTLLLDEIGDMSYALQGKLLRVLQNGEITRLGGTESVAVDVRIIASTNKDLERLAKQGLFREDLYYRLNVVPIHLPPLRERAEDLEGLAQAFLDQFNREYGKALSFGNTAFEVMKKYHWPGNVRELKSIVERLVITNKDIEIESQAMISLLSETEDVSELSCYEIKNLKEATRMFQKQIIERALKKHKSTRKAAAELGMNQSSISRKAKELGIIDW